MVAPNDILGYYRLIEKIGAGGMGEVWKAEDTRLGRVVAVKILPPEIASDQEAIARMRREARTAAQINSPNIATIYSFEEIGERLFIVMEYVEGEPLTKLIAQSPIAEAELCRIGHDVAEALAEAHAKGIIHRDIKPDNIIVSGRRVKVLDFGIAKQMTLPNVTSTDPTAIVTQQGMIIGTVNYMSPEQALGKTLDARTDIFSLGIVLYQAATGRLPFKGETMTETITKIVRDEPVEPTSINRSLSPGLAKIIARCLRKPREQRFASAADLASALESQMGKAATAPVTKAVPTVIAPTVVAPKKKRSLVPLFVALFVLAVLIAIGAITLARRAPAPAKTPPPVAANKPNPPSTATVESIAPGPTATAADVPAATSSTPLSGAPAPSPVLAMPTKTPSADQSYAQGLTDLVEGRPAEARQQFQAAIDADPHHAKAHFRMGEIKLANHDVNGARDEFKAAILDGDRLDDRERKLAHLGLAITNQNWPRAKEIAEELNAQHPNDADLAAFARFVKNRQPSPRPFRGRRQH